MKKPTPRILSSDARFTALLGLFQGALLWLMHDWLVRQTWPAPKPEVVVVWYTLSLAVPWAIQLMAEYRAGSRLWSLVACLTLVLGAAGWYTGRSIEVMFDAWWSSWYYVWTVWVAWFVTLPFFQTALRNGRWKFPYPALFEYSWNNMLSLLTAGVFMCLLESILMLWAGLFRLIGVAFFWDVFTHRGFLYLVLPAAFGFALSFGRAQGGLIAGLRAIVLLIFKVLLPLLSVMAILFPLTMLVLFAVSSGELRGFLESQISVGMMLNLQWYLILAFNAVYQDGTVSAPYSRAIHRIVRVSLIVLPALAVLCAVLLVREVSRGGWHPWRVCDALTISIFILYGIGYAVTAWKHQSPWMRWAAPVNVRVAFVVIVVALLVNTPVLDPQRISVASQINRLLSGEVSADSFEYSSLLVLVGRPGREALERLTHLEDHPDAAVIQKRSQAALDTHHRKEQRQQNNVSAPRTLETTAQLRSVLTVRPVGHVPAPAFMAHLLGERARMTDCLGSADTRSLVSVDLNDDGQEEYVLFCAACQAHVFEATALGWERVGPLVSASGSGRWRCDEREGTVQAGDYDAAKQTWNALRIGEERFFVGTDRSTPAFTDQ